MSGWFRAREPLQALNAFVLVPRDDGDETGLERLIVSVTDVGQVEAVASAVRDLIGGEAADGVTIDRSPELLAAREAVQDQVAASDRLLVLPILAAMAPAGVVVLFEVLAARRDLGRRRALGATRSQLTTMVILQTLWPALVGAALGALAGWAYASLKAGYGIDWQFAAAVGVLTVIALGAAATMPAVVAATRDPLRVLRVP
ncbi:MAG: FtsX-like permease family protein [Chloroflexota bacterium]